MIRRGGLEIPSEAREPYGLDKLLRVGIEELGSTVSWKSFQSKNEIEGNRDPSPAKNTGSGLRKKLRSGLRKK